ncbi:unnamed protein product [Symbiodinium necroappetens]|uniref:Uncharacterized protein n=1 Tax=Symbiodinium necroappetens TaxID=1628268 RepID=A0A812YDR8_9DINO|nr:unnamed protein product [Symbiodinium necroappetens]
MEAPKWLDDDGKDLFNDIENDENPHSDAACESREKLLKAMVGKGDSSASNYRARTLLGCGLCEMKKANWMMAKRRLESAISEMNVPSEEMMLKNPDLAPIALTKQAADFMKKFELTQAGTQLRRCREVLERNVKTVLKRVHQQMSQSGQAVPLEKFVEEIPGLGKTGQFLPSLLTQVPGLREVFGFMEVVESSLDSLDAQVAVRALFMQPVVPFEQLAVAKELVDSGAAKAISGLAASQAASLIKRTKTGSGCKEELSKVCEKLSKIADIQSNGFGETRLLVLKEGKKQSLDACTTNANVGILVAAQDGARLTVAGQEPTPLKAGEPVVFDVCLEASLQAEEKLPVLLAQAWHPEFAAVERTTELRARASAFGLSEEEVKAVTKVVNDHAKSAWEKSAKHWRSTSSGLESMRKVLQTLEEDKAKAKEAAEEAKRKEDEANDEDRKRALEELERKRAERRRKEEEAEAKRLARKKQLEEERAKRDPWLLFPEVVAAEKKVEDLKEQRRDANAKLEFDLSNSLTKEISAAERALKSATKKAKKAYKKGETPSAADVSKKDAGGEEAEKAKDKTKELQAELQDVKKRKAEASKVFPRSHHKLHARLIVEDASCAC